MHRHEHQLRRYVNVDHSNDNAQTISQQHFVADTVQSFAANHKNQVTGQQRGNTGGEQKFKQRFQVVGGGLHKVDGNAQRRQKSPRQTPQRGPPDGLPIHPNCVCSFTHLRQIYSPPPKP